MRRTALLALALAVMSASSALAANAPFQVKVEDRPDEKSVFATVESKDVIPARSRLNGTVAELMVTEGDQVKQGQVIALISDAKNALRIRSINAQIDALKAQQTNANTELARAKDLFSRGIIPKSRLDSAQANADVINNQVKSQVANRNVVSQQVAEGKVLAPADGRVLSVPLTVGTVVMPGEAIATITAGNYILRMAVPERHARFMKVGDTVRVDGSLMDDKTAAEGKIAKVYPQIQDGKVIADADVAGLGDYFVGERVRVWVPVQARKAIMVPEEYVTTRYGLDFAWVKNKDGSYEEVVVQRGRDQGKEVEVLTGLQPGDELVLAGDVPESAKEGEAPKAGAH